MEEREREKRRTTPKTRGFGAIREKIATRSRYHCASSEHPSSGLELEILRAGNPSWQFTTRLQPSEHPRLVKL